MGGSRAQRERRGTPDQEVIDAASERYEQLAVLGRTNDAVAELVANPAINQPGSLPFPWLPAGQPTSGVDKTLEGIDHIIVLMMENHSFDNYLGMLAHDPSGHRDVKYGLPKPRPDGTVHWTGDYASYDLRRVTVPTQVLHEPRQTWEVSHKAWNGGRMDGWADVSKPIAFTYRDRESLPWLYSVAEPFVVCDQSFSDAMTMTHPNRRFLLAGTAGGTTETLKSIRKPNIPDGQNIFSMLNRYNISWTNYFASLPSTLLLGGSYVAHHHRDNQLVGPSWYPARTVEALRKDIDSGKLASVVVVEPNYHFASEESPQNINAGQEFAADVVRAVMSNPKVWERSLIVLTYDEHGGYFDHIAPPRALPPGDGYNPNVLVDPAHPDFYTYQGFRVPTIIISPWSKEGLVSHTTYGHTSWLATIERKWNIPALTLRDANAHDFGDCLVSSGRAPFATPPPLVTPPHISAREAMEWMNTPRRAVERFERVREWVQEMRAEHGLTM